MFLVFIAVMVYFGLGIVLMFVAYRRMVKRGRSLAVRLGVVLLIGLIIWAIPYGDHMAGKIYFNWLCKKEGGERIARTVEDVEGYMWVFGVPSRKPEGRGYRFYEDRVDKKGMTTRATVTTDGSFVVEKNVSPISRYIVKRNRLLENVQIARVTDNIEDRVTGEELARYTEFQHRGGWLMRSLEAMNAYGVVCPTRPKDDIPAMLLVQRVLKPKFQ